MAGAADEPIARCAYGCEDTCSVTNNVGDRRDGTANPSVQSYRPHGNLARVLHDKRKADEWLAAYDKRRVSGRLGRPASSGVRELRNVRRGGLRRKSVALIRGCTRRIRPTVRGRTHRHVAPTSVSFHCLCRPLRCNSSRTMLVSRRAHDVALRAAAWGHVSGLRAVAARGAKSCDFINAETTRTRAATRSQTGWVALLQISTLHS